MLAIPDLKRSGWRKVIERSPKKGARRLVVSQQIRIPGYLTDVVNLGLRVP